MGSALSGITVSVSGTSITSGIDGAGRFNLVGVPPGDVNLAFSGPGVNATLSVTQVQPAETITLVVNVSGTTAEVESSARSGGSEDQLEGRVESLPPTTAAGTFVVGGRTVKTDGSTKFLQGSATRSFADLQIGMRVHVRGRASGAALMASLVEIQNTNTSIPVEVNGVIDSLTGTAASFQFKIGSRLVKGDSATVFFGDGSNPKSFADLKDGVRVEVKGEQRDGFVYASRLHINGDDDETPEQDESASIHGTLTAMSGVKPILTLTVGGTTVRTSSSTEVKRRGDVQTLDALVIGQTLHVVGQRKPDGSLDARKIEINDDTVGGAFEIEGSVGGLSGTCPSLSFSVNGFRITTNASTTFEGAACSALKSGNKVQVKGTTQSDGSVAATLVKK
jgi:hypothetical protein